MTGRPTIAAFTSSLPLHFRPKSTSSSSLCACSAPSPLHPPALPPALRPTTALPAHESTICTSLSDEKSPETTQVAPASSLSSLSISEHIVAPREFSSPSVSISEPTPNHPSFVSSAQTPDVEESTSNDIENALSIRKRPRQSLPGRNERRYLSECTQMTRGRSYPAVRSLSFTLNSRELCGVPNWAYTAHIRAAKTVLGKRAVVRNRGKRRLRAAANQVLPHHALRQREYVFSVSPESLSTSLPELILEITSALKAANSFVEELPYELMRRRRKPPPDPHTTGSADILCGLATPPSSSK